MKKITNLRNIFLNKYYIFFVFLLTSSCNDFFLRFKHENFLCSKNKYLIEEIMITNKSKNSNVTVFINGSDQVFQIEETKNNIIYLKNKKLFINIKINSKTDKISGFFKKNSFNLKCKKKSFRM